MQILGISPELLDGDDGSSRVFARTLNEIPPGEGNWTIDESDSGLGASIPSILLTVAGMASIAITIISAPKTIAENWPVWKEAFDRAIGFMKKRFDDVYIDKKTAAVLAIHEVALLFPDYREIDILIAGRQYAINISGYDDLISEKFDGYIDETPRGNRESSVQIGSRYIFAFSIDGWQGATVIVEHDGSVSFSERMK